MPEGETKGGPREEIKGGGGREDELTSKSSDGKLLKFLERNIVNRLLVIADTSREEAVSYLALARTEGGRQEGKRGGAHKLSL